MVVIALEDTLKKFAVMRYCPSDPDLELRSWPVFTFIVTPSSLRHSRAGHRSGSQ